MRLEPRLMMAQRQITETLASLRRRWDGFFWKRARAGLPWYLAGPAGL